MSDVTITEFLLARIAELETKARALGDEPGRRWLHFLETADDTDVRAFGALANPSRVLAECQAKQRIVELCQQVDAEPNPPEALVLADHVLQLIALPNADHPSFQDEWRI